MVLFAACAALWSLGVALLDDVLQLPARPLLLLDHVCHGLPWISAALHQAGLLSHLITGVATVLVAVSITVLLQGLVIPHALAALLGVDACWQIAVGLVPGHDPAPAGHAGTVAAYPLSHTLLMPFAVQLPIACVVWSLSPSAVLVERYACLAVACCARFVAVTLFADAALAGLWCHVVMLVACVFLLTPRSWWDAMGAGVEEAARLFSALALWVHKKLIALWALWPRCVQLWHAFVSWPVVVVLNRVVLAPCWRHVAPLLLPLASLAVAVAAFAAAVHTASRPISWSSVAVAATQAACGLSALLPACVLSLSATALSVPSRRAVQWASSAAYVVGAPIMLIQRLLAGRLVLRALKAAFAVLEALGKFAMHAPLVAIPVTLVACGALLHIADMEALQLLLPWLLSWWPRAHAAVGRLQTAPLSELLGDADFALLAVTLIQCVAGRVTHALLAPALTADQFASLPADELNAMGEAMASPRQCGGCCLGPVDHVGCNNLATHHGEQRHPAGGRGVVVVSNACPRCGWFARTLDAWPRWQPLPLADAQDGSQERACHVYMQRAWSEVALATRASSKALVVPLVLLRGCTALTSSATFGALVALAYLVPWVLENAEVRSALLIPAPSRAQLVAAAAASAAPIDDAADCGASAAHQQRSAHAHVAVGESETFEALLATGPEDTGAPLFLAAKDGCAICLDEWPDYVLQAETAPGLRTLEPACLALRCGHVLHMTCARAFVDKAVAGRHLRCPLCRRPLTLAGEISAGLFS